MIKPMLALILALVLLTPDPVPAETPPSHGFTQAAEILRMQAQTQDPHVTRLWSGKETFCLIAQHDLATDTQNYVTALNAAYGTAFKTETHANPDACPNPASFFALIEGMTTPVRLADVLENIHGTRPPLRLFGGRNIRGLSMTIPGRLPREFVYVNTQVAAVPHNPNPPLSILLEEVLHAFTRLNDMPATEITSLIRENDDVEYYEEWFTKNPVGLCDADLYLLEMVIGPTGRSHGGRVVPLAWFTARQSHMATSVSRAKSHLARYLDPRCTSAP